jgi:hypothetical protein
MGRRGSDILFRIFYVVMAGRVPAIHVFESKDVDARHKAGHDDL